MKEIRPEEGSIHSRFGMMKNTATGSELTLDYFTDEDKSQIDTLSEILFSVSQELDNCNLPEPEISNEPSYEYNCKSEWIIRSLEEISPDEFVYLFLKTTDDIRISQKLLSDLESIYYRRNIPVVTDIRTFILSEITDLTRPPDNVLQEILEEEQTVFEQSLVRLIHVYLQIAGQQKDSDWNASKLNLYERRASGLINFLKEISIRVELGDIESYKKMFRITNYWYEPSAREHLTEAILGFDFVHDDWEQKTDHILDELWRN